MSLIHYEITIEPSVSKEKRNQIIKEIDDMSPIGFDMFPNIKTADFFFDSEDDLKAINIPSGCIVKKIP